ncbi:hypothetical protein EJ03DRAFT_331793 [Teratosphaeria nubilosa]|uniref:Uncharacterized protein n=1 Tax=Teratosphaeria nubilosa TaxID=161662 RepID=A0A6G1KW59_9PEZI|nr:hypothetical protein EJ03DRAFT_331793 [Teratosphaeria nubilosa]
MACLHDMLSIALSACSSAMRNSRTTAGSRAHADGPHTRGVLAREEIGNRCCQNPSQQCFAKHNELPAINAAQALHCRISRRSIPRRVAVMDAVRASWQQVM